jgi:hypothetical protein
VDFAIHAYRLAHAADTPSALAGMRADLELLLAASGSPSDDTPVPVDFFPPL